MTLITDLIESEILTEGRADLSFGVEVPGKPYRTTKTIKKALLMMFGDPNELVDGGHYNIGIYGRADETYYGGMDWDVWVKGKALPGQKFYEAELRDLGRTKDGNEFWHSWEEALLNSLHHKLFRIIISTGPGQGLNRVNSPAEFKIIGKPYDLFETGEVGEGGLTVPLSKIEKMMRGTKPRGKKEKRLSV